MNNSQFWWQPSMSVRSNLRSQIKFWKKANRELKQFACIASHDLQSPLRSITGFVLLLQHEYESELGEQAQDWIRRTVLAVARMQALIRDLLSYSGVGARFGPSRRFRSSIL
jgi:light-regulated signal transduction histidine kinase (bacteriophytochrome)